MVPASQRVAQIPWWVSPQPKTKVASKTKVKRKVVRKKRVSSFAVFVFVVTLLAAAMMINVFEHALIAQDAVELENLKAELQVEQALREDFLIKRAVLESPERIEAIATQKLGMMKPTQVDYIILPAEPKAGAKIAESDSSRETTLKGEKVALSPILGEIIQQIRITTLGDPEKDLKE